MHRMEPAIDCNWLPVSQTEHHLQIYDVSFPQMTKRCPCPFPGCLGSSRTWNGLSSQFSSQHWGDSIGILEEHPNSLPKCKHCSSQVPLGRLNTRHYVSENCKQREQRRLLCETLQNYFETSRFSFQINAEVLPPSEAFPHLGRTISYNTSN